MSNITNTEDFIVKMNYFSTSKNLSEASGSYVDALKSVINIYGNLISKGAITDEEIYDFGETLSIIEYFDRPISKVEVNQLKDHFNNTVQINRNMTVENTNSKMVA